MSVCFFFHSSTGPIHRLYHPPAHPPITITSSVILIPCTYVCLSILCFLVLLSNHPTGLCQCSPQKSSILPRMFCLPYDRAHHPSPVTHHSHQSRLPVCDNHSLNDNTPTSLPLSLSLSLSLSVCVCMCCPAIVSICLMCVCVCVCVYHSKVE